MGEAGSRTARRFHFERRQGAPTHPSATAERPRHTASRPDWTPFKTPTRRPLPPVAHPLPKPCPTPVVSRGLTGTSGEGGFARFGSPSASLARKVAYRLKVSPMPLGRFESLPLRGWFRAYSVRSGDHVGRVCSSSARERGVRALPNLRNAQKRLAAVASEGAPLGVLTPQDDVPWSGTVGGHRRRGRRPGQFEKSGTKAVSIPRGDRASRTPFHHAASRFSAP